MKRLFLLILVCALPMISFAADTVVEGFDNNTLYWRSVSSSPQTHNASNITPIIPSSAHPTEGSNSGTFATFWTVPGVDAATNYYVPGGPLMFWGVRINVQNHSLGINIPNNSTLKADVFNNTADPIQFALYVIDDGGNGGMERGPFMTLAGNASTTYQWIMGTDPTTSFISGNNVLTGSASKIKGILFYTETAPTNTSFSMDVDNIRIVGAQSDLTPPANPVILSVSQGSAAGKLLVKWVPNTEPDINKYSIKMATNSTFTGNRFGSFPTTLATITHPTTQAEVTVPTAGSVYIGITAWDNATPQNNESGLSLVLGASLKADGGPVDDLVVLDLKRYTSGADYTLQGYWHMIVYDAQALEDNGRYFASCTAPAIENGTVTLTPASDKIVIWSTARDGETLTERSVSANSITPLTTYINAGGNIMLSGIGIGKEMVTSGTATAFYTNVLKANLVNGAIASNTVIGDDIFASVGTFYTGDNIWDYAAFASSANNESIGAQPGATAAMAYSAGGHAAVYYGFKVVLLGFGFESARSVVDSTGTFAAARLVRKNLLTPIINYLMTPPLLSARTWNIYE